jgi:PAS domain S-box-containing protein
MHDLAVSQSRAGQLLSDSHYRELFEKVHDGFFVGRVVRDDDGVIRDFVFLETNEAFVRQTGVAAKAALGRGVREAIPGFPADIIARYAAVVETGRPDAFEVVVPALDNRAYEARAHPLGDERFAVLFVEITDRKRAEAELKAHRASLASIVDYVDQMIWTTRPDGYHDFYNRRWYEFTGVPPGSTDGEAWNGMFHPDDQDRAWARWRRSLQTGEPYEIEYRLRHRSGVYRWVLGRAHPVRSDTGEIIQWMGTCTDIHEQKELREQLELASRELSHRIKNIFAVIAGLIGLSARQRPEAKAFAADLRERILALAEAHDYARPVGTSAHACEMTVLGLVRLLLKPYELEGQVRVVSGGDDAPIDEQGVTPVSLAVHELATNAAKYGALSAAAGRVEVSWRVEDGRLDLQWREHGGPPVSPPSQRGFGSRLVQGSVSGELAGEAELSFEPEGFRCRLTVPLGRAGLVRAA